ncbi:MAG TPA: NADH-quinone oxidoreductase subunit C [Actinomycetes bacterium]|nr:NADH-quinone oxidoreductase subunit C [Actinomycetes bacterium]
MTWADEVAGAFSGVSQASRVSEGSAETAFDATVSEVFGDVTVDVPDSQWVAALTTARDVLNLNFFDWLSAVDEGDDGFRIVAHVYDPAGHRRLLLRTLLSATSPRVDTATDVFRGTSWHERETHEMFGIDFVGHPYLVPLLLPDGFEGHPLRKEFVLAARAAKPWPGAKDPGESDHDAAPSRRKTLPPGVPDPTTWGPRAPGAQP